MASDGKPLGGFHSQCLDAATCTENQNRVIRYLDVLPGQDAKGHGKDTSKGKGKRKYEDGYGKSSSSSSHNEWR